MKIERPFANDIVTRSFLAIVLIGLLPAPGVKNPKIIPQVWMNPSIFFD
jgi:hypothetical protein